MRNSFIDTITQITSIDKRLMVITADMGFSVFESYREKFPENILNVGISEANMIGLSAGLAMNGKIPIAYSIIPFLTMRCFEQIRVDLCYQNLNVKLVGSGGGLSYGLLGPTHHSTEDISIMRSIPNMCVICPADSYEAHCAVKAAYERPGPVYIRLGKNEPTYHSNSPDFKIGKGIVAIEGDDLTIITTGAMFKTGLDVVDQLSKAGINARLVSMHTIKPLDTELIIECANTTKAIVTIEEHSLIGGLGSAVAETLVDNQIATKLKRFALPDEFSKTVGGQSYLLSLNRLTSKDISNEILRLLR